MPPATVPGSFRQVFARGGRPQGWRLDNGLPWANGNDWPMALAWGRVGWGVDRLVNPPRPPQCNAVVAKAPDTGHRWCAPPPGRTPAQWPTRLAVLDRRQRADDPRLQGRSRLEVFPEVRPRPRPYPEAWEQEAWDVRRAQDYRAGLVAVRQANQQGPVSSDNRRAAVGARHRGQTIVVPDDPDGAVGRLSDTAGRLVRAVAAPAIGRERIRAVKISGQ